jgi:hypothetical protein
LQNREQLLFAGFQTGRPAILPLQPLAFHRFDNSERPQAASLRLEFGHFSLDSELPMA